MAGAVTLQVNSDGQTGNMGCMGFNMYGQGRDTASKTLWPDSQCVYACKKILFKLRIVRVRGALACRTQQGLRRRLRKSWRRA